MFDRLGGFVPLGEAEQEHQTEQQNSKHSKDLTAIVPCSALFAEFRCSGQTWPQASEAGDILLAHSASCGYEEEKATEPA